jgi:hypothetical protein
MAKKSRSAEYYANNPEAKKKKQAYDKKFNSTKEQLDHRAELARERRKTPKSKRTGQDVSHTKSGKTVLEPRSKNRARNGANGKSTKK